MQIRKLVQVLLAAGALMLMTGCTTTGAGSSSDGTLRVAINPGFVPFEQVENGELVGFDVDLANAVAAKLGKRARFDQMPFTSLLAAVKSGRADVAMSGILGTPERQKEVAFSKPYMHDSFVLTISESNTSVTQLADLERARIAVQVGTIPEEFVREKLASATFVTVQDTPAAFQLVAQGRADAVVTDAPVAGYYVQKVGGLKMLPTPLNTAQPIVAALAKDSPLTPQIDKALDELTADGTLTKLRAKWFGELAPEGDE